MAASRAVKRIIHGDNARLLSTLPARFARLIYIDPPFNTGKPQQRNRIKITQSHTGDRSGFGGRRYASESIASASYRDSFDDFSAFLMPRIKQSLGCLTEDGSLFVHLDAHESHYVKVELDRLLGRECFMNEIIWAYDYGGRPKNRWPAKHDSILWYALNPKRYVYNYDAIDRIPYMAPGLVTEEKRARGKTPTDVWWNTIVPTMGKEKTGYPTQKPIAILNRIVRVHSDPGDIVLDYFAGSGTTGEAAALNDRGFVLIDESPDAIDVMQKRLKRFAPDVTR